jgi:pimeloyl-ACP methyl ester carboxylesterase
MRLRRMLVLGTAVLLPTALIAAALAGTAAAASTPAVPAPIPAQLSHRAALPELPLLTQPTKPDQDSFYRRPSDTDDADPGDVLRYRRSNAYLAPGGLVPAPVRAWQVLYRSTTARDEPDAVSGTVLVPDAPWLGSGPRPLVSYTIGTHGLADECAPSYEMASGTESEFALMSLALSRGWAVAVTDYEGLGTPGDHTYTVQLSEGRAALDMARAAIRLPAAGLSERTPVGLWGYSQGGGAAASAAEQAGDYASDLHLVGVAEGGVPADLDAVARFNDGGIGFGLVAAAAAGYDAAYPGLDLPDRLLNAKGRALIDEVRRECTTEITARRPGQHLSAYTTVKDPLSYPPLARALRANRIGGQAPDMPVFLYHAQFDELIPIAVSRKLRAEYCSRDVRLQYTVVPATEHVTGAILGAPSAVAWLAGRFAGHTAPRSCG